MQSHRDTEAQRARGLGIEREKRDKETLRTESSAEAWPSRVLRPAEG